jgi:uncharacterized membrane protein
MDHLYQHNKDNWECTTLGFKLLACSACRMLFSGVFSGVCSLNDNISEHTVCSIFRDE